MAGPSSCWASVDSTDKREGQVVHLRIYLLASAALINVHLGLFTFSKRIFEQQKHLAGQENVTDVSGFGDDAYYAQIGPETYLNVKKGDIEVQVAWSGTTDHQTVMDGEKTIAAQVLSEL
jgi:hypothetical protein